MTWIVIEMFICVIMATIMPCVSAGKQDLLSLDRAWGLTRFPFQLGPVNIWNVHAISALLMNNNKIYIDNNLTIFLLIIKEPIMHVYDTISLSWKVFAKILFQGVPWWIYVVIMVYCLCQLLSKRLLFHQSMYKTVYKFRREGKPVTGRRISGPPVNAGIHCQTFAMPFFKYLDSGFTTLLHEHHSRIA